MSAARDRASEKPGSEHTFLETLHWGIFANHGKSQILSTGKR
jgi:hypothetical protein